MRKKTTFLLTLILLSGFLGGCSNTWDGAGKDLQDIGGWLEETF